MPIFILDYISTTTGTCDRLVLLKLGGVKLVGYYAVALMARDAIGIIPGALSEYIYPRMSHSFGQHHDPIRLWKMAVKSSLMVVGFMTPAAIAGWLLLPPVVSKLFPQYTEAVRAAQWLLISSVFGGATLGRMAIWSMKDWKVATWYQALGIAFGITGIILGGYFGKTPLIGVAVGSVAAQVAWLPIGGYLVYLATHRRVAPSGK
jgi:O-antigen/teichoic acid export membrane protein